MLTDRELIKQEWARCYRSAEYFIQKYVFIQNPNEGGSIPFDLYPFQVDLLKQFTLEKYLLILKSRQLGITTLIAAYALWDMLFHSDRNILFVSIKQDTSKDVITKIKFAFDKLPPFLKLETEERNRLSIRFSNGSQIQAVSSASDSGRSKSVSLLVLDEAAFIESAEDLWASAFNTLSTGGRAIVLSTPNGVGNWFYSTWSKALNGENNFKTLCLKWSVHPKRDQAWRNEQTKQLGEALASQECDASFLSSGENVISLKVLENHEKEWCCEPIEKRWNDCLWVWEKPKPSRRYCLFADTASGSGPDYSVCHVFDIDRCVQAAELKIKIETRQFGRLLIELAKEYNGALIIIEREAYGDAVIQEIKDNRYPNLYHSENDLRLVEDNKNEKKDPRYVAGVKVNSNTRPRIIETLIQYFNDQSVFIRSKRTVNELRNFIWRNNKPQASAGLNDDLVMSLAIGLWTRNQAICRNRPAPIHVSNIQVERLSETSSLVPKEAVSQWQWRVGDRNVENLTWLLN